MARQWFLFGGALIRVKGNPGGFLGVDSHIAPQGIYDLGLTMDPIRLVPRFIQQDIRCDDFGPDIPADVLQYLADIHIHMKLVHYDPVVLARCIAESLTEPTGGNPNFVLEGTLGQAGTPLGGGVPFGTQGNRYISLNVLGVGGDPNVTGTTNWIRFPTVLLAERPFEYPLGAEKSVVLMDWRAVPYAPILNASNQGIEPTSPGKVLWDYNIDAGVLDAGLPTPKDEL